MKEEVEKVLSDETYTTNEEKVNAITASLATLVFPKDKFNDVNEKLKASESNYATLQTEFEDFKKSKMTEDEKVKAMQEQFENDVRANAITKSDLAVKGLLLDNGIQISDEDEELKETLSNIVSEDYEKSIKLANSFISILKKTQDTTQKQTVTDLLNGTPKPIGGTDANPNVSKVDELNKQLEEAIKNKDQILQTQLRREIFAENKKQVNKI